MDKAASSPTSSQIHAGHRDRQKKRFIENGDFKGFADHNILEMLLFYSIPRKDTNELAHALINRFGSLQRVLEASYEDLITVNGISENSACLIKMMLPLYRRYAENCVKEKKTFEQREDIIEYLKSIYTGMSEEQINLLCFDSKMNLITRVVLGTGDISSAGFSMRKLVEAAIGNNACTILLAHNHPHSLASPSRADIDTTEKICQSMKELNINVLDHIIIANDQYCSCLDGMRYWER